MDNHLHMIKSASRQSKILELIRQKQRIHHNALKKLVVPRYMSNQTFVDTVKFLTEMNGIQVAQYGDNKKYYTLPSAELPDEDTVSRITIKSYKSMEQKVKELKGVYQKFSVQEKTIISIQYITSIFSALNGITLYMALSDSKLLKFKRIEENYRKRIQDIFNMIGNDKQRALVFPLVFDSIFQISEYEKILGIKN